MARLNGYVSTRGNGKSKRYVVNWRCPKTSPPRHHTMTFDRQRAAQRQLVTVREATAKGECIRCDRPNEELTLGEFIRQTWLPRMESSAGSPNTAAWYETQLGHIPWTEEQRKVYHHTGRRPKHGLPDLWEKPLSDFERLGEAVQLIEEVLALRAETRRPDGKLPSQSSVKAVRTTMSRIFSDARRWGKVSVNPVEPAKTPRVSDIDTGLPSSAHDATTEAERLALIEAEEEEAEEAVGTTFTLTPDMVPTSQVVWRLAAEMGKFCPDYELVVLVGAATGLRYGELMALRPESFIWNDGRYQVRVTHQIVEVYGKRRNGGPIHRRRRVKSKASERTVDVAPAINGQLRQFLAGKPHRREIFRSPEGKRIYRSRFADRMRRAVIEVRKWAAEEGVAVPEKLTLHRLRHRWASEILSLGVGVHEVKRQLGHNDITVTLQIYSHWLPRDRDKVFAALDRML